MKIPECWYRVSIKALVLNKTRDKFLICKEENGKWELPGGGLDWGMTPQEDLPREISEEMGVGVVFIAQNPSYFLTFNLAEDQNPLNWRANVLYETVLESLDFTPSDECIAVQFVNKDDIGQLDVFPNVEQLIELFDAEKHTTDTSSRD